MKKRIIEQTSTGKIDKIYKDDILFKTIEHYTNMPQGVRYICITYFDKYGFVHRDDNKPAVIYVSNYECFFHHGKQIKLINLREKNDKKLEPIKEESKKKYTGLRGFFNYHFIN